SLRRFLYRFAAHRDLRSFPTRRSSDLWLVGDPSPSRRQGWRVPRSHARAAKNRTKERDMRVLLIGSGGREHALAWAMNRSARLEKLFVAPGNGGTAQVAEHAGPGPGEHAAVVALCRPGAVGLVARGPEAPLGAGIADALRDAGIPVFGPSRAAARLEGSKAFTKALCDEMEIPTAAYARFTEA